MAPKKEWIQKYQLEKIFPAHYFDKLQMISFSAGQAICQQGEELQALSYFVKGKIIFFENSGLIYLKSRRIPPFEKGGILCSASGEQPPEAVLRRSPDQTV